MRGLTRLAQPLLLALDPERAHGLAISALKAGAHPVADNADVPALATGAFGLAFRNPLGMAAGFDKNGEVPDALLATGFGFTEVGSVTPHPQSGNPTPRVFRLMDRRAVINRLGFNNDGHAAVLGRLRHTRFKGIVGINVGANKDSADRVQDYANGVRTFAPIADYITVNISSPNTPGLRDLQDGEDLDRLLGAVADARAATIDKAKKSLPILLKVAPDLDDAQIEAIVAAANAHGVDGLIISNTTINRDAIHGHPLAGEAGGLSGAPLFHRSTVQLARFYEQIGGTLPLIGVGGITSGADAWEKIKAGATLVQLYTGLIYGGFGLVEDILSTLVQAARRGGYERVQDAVGTDAAAWARRSLEEPD